MTGTEIPCENCKCKISSSSIIPLLPESPVPHALSRPHQNLSFAEGTAVRSTLDTANVAKTVLLERMAELRSLLQDCETSYQQHEEFVQRHTSLLVTSQRLPAEVWQHIFELASLQPIQPSGSRVFRSATIQSALLSLSHCCREWRRLALQTPILWTQIDFSVVLNNFPPSKFKLLTAFLARSQKRLLDVSVAVLASTDDTPGWDGMEIVVKESIHKVISLLSSHSFRWRTAKFTLPQEVYSGGLFPVPSTPELASLSIKFEETALENSPTWVPSFLINAPKLTEFSLHNFVPSVECMQGLIPWETLTKVTCRISGQPWGFNGHHVAYIIEHCPKMNNLDIRGLLRSPAALEERWIQTELKSLFWYSPTTELLRFLSTPSLCHLSLKAYSSSSDSSLQALKEFLAGCHSLKSLNLISCERLALLETIPAYWKVEHLFIQFCDLRKLDTQSMGVRTLEGLQPSHFPSLQSFTIRLQFSSSTSEVDIAGLPLVDVFHSLALRFLSSLRTFHIIVHRKNMHEMILEAFINLKEIGIERLDIDIQ